MSPLRVATMLRSTVGLPRCIVDHSSAMIHIPMTHVMTQAPNSIEVQIDKTIGRKIVSGSKLTQNILERIKILLIERYQNKVVYAITEFYLAFFATWQFPSFSPATFYLNCYVLKTIKNS